MPSDPSARAATVVALIAALAVATHAMRGEHGPAAPAPRYGRDVRPLLSDRCFPCHGPDEATRRADLRLDQRESAVAERDGGPAIVPGEVGSSQLWRRITHEDPDESMPPEDSGRRPLSTDERELLRRWIESGAEYEGHWAFTPPTRPAPPPVRDEPWVRNPIDRFVLARLEAEGIVPSPEAERATLLRRVFLDLTGLPPTLDEQELFLADLHPDAYERQVARLLHEEPYRSRYAERMATPWLDAARYADTSGIHMDAGRQIWPWRDWVLRALRDGMPYDRFVTEQLAGDLLPNATRDQLVASGFHRNHVTTDEGGAIDEEYRVEYAVDRTATTGSVFLGLTMGCARCHDHKFDPITQADFFGLYAYFDSIEEPGIYSQVPDAQRALEPFMSVPTPEQDARRGEIDAALASARAELDDEDPQDAQRFASFLAGLPSECGLEWLPAELVSAESEAGATLEPQSDGSVLASGANPERDAHVLTLRTRETGLRALHLEALQDASLPLGRVGRAPNGNAVLSSIEVEAISELDPAQRATVRLAWAVADREQQNGDFEVVNALDPSPERGWAVAAHESVGGREALFLSDEPFGFEGGTLLRVRLAYESIYAQHALGRVRVAVGRIAEDGLARLPVADSRWYTIGGFGTRTRDSGYEERFGPEERGALDFARRFGENAWTFEPRIADGAAFDGLAGGPSVSYVAKRLFVPSARALDVALGSDDGVQVFLDGAQVFENRTDRAVAPDQDRFTLALEPGVHELVLKIVNTGGQGGMYWSMPQTDEIVLADELCFALLPAPARARGADDLERRIARAWRSRHSPGYREALARTSALEAELAALERSVPLTMVMKELAEPRPTYLLMRGQYDQPDTSRAIARGVPPALGALPADAPPDRRGLAQWLVAAENPLVARVAVNRWWELVFGSGIVRTSEDFGLQGEWPSHPELLDWLAVELRESGWDVKRMLALFVTSATYRQESRRRPELAERDPDGRLLAAYPRRRLGAEEIRDQALYVSGLLVERFGGPSVKPYQPEGLWREVAMPQSNTREFVRGEGEDLWRRSLYTYWKRACPPPALMAFDAPTREFCNVRRATTNTPLQALVLWNDEQHVEAARVLAQRVLAEMPPTPGQPQAGAAAGAIDADGWRLERLFRRATSRAPEPEEFAALRGALDATLERYRAAPEEAERLIAVGEAPLPNEYDAPALAAWMLVANAVLSLDATISRR